MMQLPVHLPLGANDILDDLLNLGVLEEIDYHFARTMASMASEPPPPEVFLGLAFASRSVGLGHVCAELKLLGKARPLDRDGNPVEIQLPPYTQWVNHLSKSPLVALGEDGRAPLVLERKSGRLYLSRYYAYQRDLVTSLIGRAQKLEQVDGALLRAGLKCYFGPGNVREDHQRLAALVALLRNFCVISGGPGTGKTTTVTRILALLVEQALERGNAAPKILLLAPTGKAAARLGESIKIQKEKLVAEDDVLAAIPEDGATIHRILGWQPDRPTRFNHDGNNPLHADVVLVDEASMVDVGLMAKLVRAVPPHARLILLGDKDQLASVEAGAILGDITGGSRAIKINTFSTWLANHAEVEVGETLETTKRAPAKTGIWDCVVHLTRSYRFNDKSGIGLLARGIQRGRVDLVMQVLEEEKDNDALLRVRDVNLVPLVKPAEAEEALNRYIEHSFRAYLEERDPARALYHFDRARLLCAHRRGPMGVEVLNQHAERLLGELDLINPRDPYYLGRPVMITRNDYQFELFNGDIGIIKRDPETGQPMVFFPTRQGPPRKLAPGHLPPHETVYAMTVHKSQGSEFNHVALLLPPEISPIITRELIYTAVTRARHQVTIFGDMNVLEAGIKARIRRASGLRDSLWGDLGESRSSVQVEEPVQSGWQQLELF